MTRKNPVFYFLLFVFLLPSMDAVFALQIQSSPADTGKTNFYTLRKAFYARMGTVKNEKNEWESKEEGLYRQFQRMENFIAPRVYPSGNFNSGNLWKEWEASDRNKANTRTTSAAGNWSLIGPTSSPGGFGLGRVNCIRFDPFNSKKIWLGSPDGGLWGSTDGGNTWTTNTAFLTNIGVADIAINPVHPDTMYLATGDGYGYDDGTGHFWGGTYSAGILKSADGGNTWNTTGLNYLQSVNIIVHRVIISPANTNLIVAATSGGIYRSTNAGVTWIRAKTGDFYGVEFNTANPAIVYAGGNSGVFLSTNSGTSWAVKNTACVGSGNRVSIAVTPANPQVVYALCGDYTLYKSTDGGNTYIAATGTPNSGANFYGYYDEVLAVSPVDENTILCGGMDLILSSDGGTTWNSIGGSIHPDNHAAAFLPGSNTTIFSGNDGGIFASPDQGNNWTDQNSTLSISQLYRVANAATDPNIIYMGVQDNSTFSFNNGAWDSHIGGDGQQCIIDYTDPNIIYGAYQYGVIEKSTNGGAFFNQISPNVNGSWTTPYVMDPNNHLILYAGYAQVYKTTDGGSNWNTISGALTHDSALAVSLAVAPSNTNFIYVATLDSIYMTPNGGITWKNIHFGLPVLSITKIAISNTNPGKIWVTLSGYYAGNKVYTSADTGSTWTNVSGTLPNIPVDCIVYQNGSSDGLYIGTDFGVYYTNASMSDWIPFNAGLPNVIVNDLEIQYGSRKLRAGTYGRGLWESGLYSPAGIQNFNSINELQAQLFPNPSTGSFNVLLNSNAAGNALIEVFNVRGEKVYGGIVPLNQSHLFDFSELSDGLYLMQIKTGSAMKSERFVLTR